MNIKERIIDKILSARFLVTLIVIGTLCWSVGKSIDMAASVVQDEKMFTLAKEITMFILGAFVSVVTAIVTSYFGRTDRHKTVED